MRSILAVIDSMSLFPTRFEPGESAHLLGTPRDFPQLNCGTFLMKRCRRVPFTRELQTVRPYDVHPHTYKRTEYSTAATAYVIYVYDHTSGAVTELEHFTKRAPAVAYLASRECKRVMQEAYDKHKAAEWQAKYGRPKV